MSDSTQSAGGRLVALHGDLVCGLASPMPPQPFVGELSDPTTQAADAVTEPLLRAAGSPPPQKTLVTINGKPVATRKTQASQLAPPPPGMPGLGTTMLGSNFVALEGDPFARQADPSQTNPSSAMSIIGGAQTFTGIRGSDTREGERPAQGLASARESAPTRSTYGQASRSHELLSRTSAARRGDLVPPEHAVVVGDPVNVVTGAVVTAATEFHSIAPAVEFRRYYASNRTGRSGPLGPGWGHNLDQAIWLEPGRVVLRDADGREIEFDCMELTGQVARAGDELFDATGRLRLRCVGQFCWTLHERGGVRQFRPAAGESAQGRDRGLSRLCRVARAGEATIELTYDKSARLAEVRVADRAFLGFGYDDDDRIVSVWTPTGERLRRHATFEYSAAGDLCKATDALGRSREYEYQHHLLVREANRAGGSFYYGYDGFGPHAKCVRTWGSGGYLDRVLEYNGPSTSVTDSRGSVTTYSHDEIGLVTQRLGPLGDSTGYRYDEALRLTDVSYPDGTTAKDYYDDAGRVIKRRTRDGATWRMRYDQRTGNLVERIGPSRARFSFAYDGAGRLVKVEDPCGHVTRLEYADRRLKQIVDPLGQVTSVSQGPGGEVETLGIAGHPPTRFEYDALGRLTAVERSDGARAVWSYDLDGGPIGVDTSTESTRFQRDAQGRVIEVAHGELAWRAKRDPFGRIVALEAGDVTLGYDYDDEGDLTRVTRSGSTALVLERDAAGHVGAYSFEAGEPCVVRRKPNTPLVASLVRGAQTLSMSWDKGQRITAVQSGGEAIRRFEYREDGFVMRAETGDVAYSVDRDARGGVVSQSTAGCTLRSGPLDHRGRRFGLELDGEVQLSYLRTVGGDLERIVASRVHPERQGVFEVRTERSPGGRHEIVSCDDDTVEIHRDAWGRTTAAQSGRGDRGADRGATWSWPAKTPPGPEEAAHNDGPQPVVWDEGRVIQRGDAVLIHHPDTGDRIGVLTPDAMTLELPDPVSLLDTSSGLAQRANAADASIGSEQAQLCAECFPTLVARQDLAQVCPTPIDMVEQRFSYRAWNATARPVPGTQPWDPDGWRPSLEGPAAPDGRLTQEQLLRILGGPAPAAPQGPSTQADG